MKYFDSKSVVVVFPSQSRGGCEEYALTVAKALHERGFEVHTLFPHTEGTATLRSSFNALEASYTPLLLRYWQPGRFRRIRLTWDILRIAVSILSKRPKAVHISLPWPNTATELLLACALLRIRTVVVFQLVGEEFHLSASLARKYLWAKTNNQEWVAVSENNRKILCNVFSIPISEIHLIPNGVALAPSSQVKQAEIAKLVGKKSVILTVARLSFQKGIDLLLRAFAAVVSNFPDYQLILIGDGELTEELKNLAAELAISGQVLFLGRRPDVNDWLRISNLFVLPSRSEGLSFALLEAMAAGVPILASDASSIPDLIEDGLEGILFENGSVEDLTEKLFQALSNPQNRQEMASNARRKAEGFSQEKMVERTLKLLVGKSAH